MATWQRINDYKQAKGNEGNENSPISENASINNSNQNEMANWQRINIYKQAKGNEGHEKSLVTEDASVNSNQNKGSRHHRHNDNATISNINYTQINKKERCSPRPEYGH